jgi:ferrochelatase
MNGFAYKIVILWNLILLAQVALAQDKIGVLFSSYGDIDNVNTELAPFIRTALTDPDILPLPAWLRSTIAEVGLCLEEKSILDEYRSIGGASRMRALSTDQANSVASLLRQRGYDVKAYVGFTMTFPFVADALVKAQSDNIEKMYVFNQGGQYSKVTNGITFRHIRNYLAQHPEWNVEVTGIKSFSDDPRFVDLIAKRVDDRMALTFAGFSPEEICLFFPIHGNLWYLGLAGDPYIFQIERLKKELRRRYPSSPFFIGFQNHDEIPFLKWTQPSIHQALSKVAEHSCPAVLINGLASFTVDNLETLYEHEIEIPEILSQEVARKGMPPKDIIVEKMFNDDQDFVEFLANLVEEARQRKGDLLLIK